MYCVIYVGSILKSEFLCYFRMNWKQNLKSWRVLNWKSSFFSLQLQLQQLQCMFQLGGNPLALHRRSPLPRKMSWLLCRLKWHFEQVPFLSCGTIDLCYYSLICFSLVGIAINVQLNGLCVHQFDINLCTVEFTCIIIVWNELSKVACHEKFDNHILCISYWFCCWLWLSQNFAGNYVHDLVKTEWHENSAPSHACLSMKLLSRPRTCI